MATAGLRLRRGNGGSAPGLTNVMAREGVDGLDEVDAIRIRDYSMVASDESPSGGRECS